MSAYILDQKFAEYGMEAYLASFYAWQSGSGASSSIAAVAADDIKFDSLVLYALQKPASIKMSLVKDNEVKPVHAFPKGQGYAITSYVGGQQAVNEACHNAINAHGDAPMIKQKLLDPTKWNLGTDDKKLFSAGVHCPLCAFIGTNPRRSVTRYIAREENWAMAKAKAKANAKGQHNRGDGGKGKARGDGGKGKHNRGGGVARGGGRAGGGLPPPAPPMVNTDADYNSAYRGDGISSWYWDNNFSCWWVAPTPAHDWKWWDERARVWRQAA